MRRIAERFSSTIPPISLLTIIFSIADFFNYDPKIPVTKNMVGINAKPITPRTGDKTIATPLPYTPVAAVLIMFENFSPIPIWIVEKYSPTREGKASICYFSK